MVGPLYRKEWVEGSHHWSGPVCVPLLAVSSHPHGPHSPHQSPASSTFQPASAALYRFFPLRCASHWLRPPPRPHHAPSRPIAPHRASPRSAQPRRQPTEPLPGDRRRRPQPGGRSAPGPQIRTTRTPGFRTEHDTRTAPGPGGGVTVRGQIPSPLYPTPPFRAQDQSGHKINPGTRSITVM